MGNRDLFYVLAKVAIERKLAIAISPKLRGAAVARRAQMGAADVSKDVAKMTMSGPVQQEVEGLATRVPKMFSGKGGEAKKTTETVTNLIKSRKLNPQRLQEAAKSRGY